MTFYRDGKSMHVCRKCKRLQPDDKLNIEGVIHHGLRRPECLDQKSCIRAARKPKRRMGA